MNIYLVGMPGCGKSTLGTRLAERLGYSFIDMDSYIERKACMFIDEIFEAYGEKFFRDLETNTLKSLADLDNTVIATGGGVIKNKKNKELFNGKCVYLEVPLIELEYRLRGTEDVRPLLRTKSVSQLYDERKDSYQYFQDITVSNTDIEAAIKGIIEKL